MKALFLSDNHYGTYGGRELLPTFERRFEQVVYVEDDYGRFLLDADLEQFEILITSAIGDTPGAPHAPFEAEPSVFAWAQLGRPMILLHGGSATFWRWSWWREAVGLRWVRGNDPDGVAASAHPVTSYELKRPASPHPLTSQLREWVVPTDELYIELEETRPIHRLLETKWQGKNYPLAYASRSQWGSLVLGYLPGHDPQVVRNENLQSNVAALARYASSWRPLPLR